MHLYNTDAYKFPMAAAGFPLRKERFYYSHRQAGPHYLPFDPATLISTLAPTVASPEDYSFLELNGLGQSSAYWAAMAQPVKVHSIPQRTWFFDREPVFSLEGPSAAVSWLEPLILQLNYRIQIATEAMLRPQTFHEVIRTVTCEEQKLIVQETLDAIHFRGKIDITVDTDTYAESVARRVRELVEVLGDPQRLFEVGMRSVSCAEQHRIALQAAKSAGLPSTSNVWLAQSLGLHPVGTMGHEHIQRHGSDEAAFRAMRERTPRASSFLLDTFSTLDSGIPTAYRLITEDASRNDFIRFDSGDKRSQFIYAVMKARGMGIRPRFILEDSFNIQMTKEFEDLRRMLGVPPEDVIYGYGGYIVKDLSNSFTRDRVSAVYKLCQTGTTPTMKFGDEAGAGKESIPGRPVLYRPRLGSSDFSGPTGIVAQEGEEVSPEYIPLTTEATPDSGARLRGVEALHFAKQQKLAYSPQTEELVRVLRQQRAQSLRNAR